MSDVISLILGSESALPKSMLQLQQTCTEFPAAGVQHLILQQDAFLVHSLFFNLICITYQHPTSCMHPPMLS